ncbi:P-loop ATPase, Sll1717 family [Pseudomonas oryzihabitans]|uniref:P-loop ATPase, Sll1717 family n=1 Tax=Pseudomonas oryzihabitans TaxID=47885 RepID=UPI00214EE0D9|nr:hypothetical protein [Pseudomonas psychrotolerans]UUW73641.1 hypothetical protein NRG74_09735 [Pseudomonas psychrotolerans]
MLKLKDISLGSTDAKNEVLSNTPEEVRRFVSSFVSPPALAVDKFFSRHKYYVVGLKGTGKTALLRYISLKLEEDEKSISSFVLFKTDVDEDLRKDFSRAARVQVVSENADTYDGDDFETVWRWFIYRKIASVIQDKQAHPFQENGDLSSFLELVSSEAMTKPERAGLMRLVPNIRKGTIEISQSPKLGLELDWDDNGRAKVNFNDLVRRADQAFESLEPDETRLNVFFDELELNYGSSKQYQRDSRLVRDLIVSIERLNAVSKKKGFQLCLYAAVRSEVLGAVDALGKEINKPIADFGSTILWNRPGLDAAQQPLLSIIEQRINIARAEAGLSVLASAALWDKYFPERINNLKPQVYILHSSWYRPRDVVRLLISIQDQYPEEESFILQGIEAVRKIYSTASWVEVTEELKAKYKPGEIDGIKYIFYGFRQISSLADLVARADAVAQDHAETKQLLVRTPLREILKDLFRVGVIGNIDARRERMRFSFRGDDEILFDNDIFVHNALRAHLSIFK